MSTSAIVLEKVGKQFPKAEHPALDQLDAEIRAGAITGIVGSDGSGKTTLMRLMVGLLVPTQGKVSVWGLNPAAHQAQLRDFIGYMPQKFGLYEDLTVQENLNLHADLRGVVGDERKATFERLLTFTELGPFTSRFAGKLSGGMKQKLGLACALLGHPRVLFLDEPSVGVDPISRRELWDMVRELTRSGMTVVWSTSYLDEAEKCDDVLLLNGGRLLFAGPPSELTKRVEGRCFLLRQIEGRKRQVLARLLSCPEVLDATIQGNNIHLLLNRGSALPKIGQIEAGTRADFIPIKPHFEDAFMDVLGRPPRVESVWGRQTGEIAPDGAQVVNAVDLSKKFGDFVAVDRVTFSVTRGEIFGLLGPNGAGKSTTFKMMCGLLTASSGSAKVMKVDLRKSASEARQHIGYMAQKFSLYGNLTVQQNLMFFSGVYGLKNNAQRKTVETMIDLFHLKPFLHGQADTLPLGYKQRLALACALMHGPDILFLDEPTSGVDLGTRRQFWSHINELVETGITVVVTTHFLEEAEYCDRIGLIFRGRLIATGSPDDLKKLVATPALPAPTMEDAFVELIQRSSE